MRQVLIKLCAFLILFASCTGGDDTKKSVKSVLGSHFTFGKSNGRANEKIFRTGQYENYKIVSYVDSLGCISCKLKLEEWKEFKDSISIPIIFIISPQIRKNLSLLYEIEGFTPDTTIVDFDEILKKKNHIPDDLILQTFLLNSDNTIVVVGNPVHNRAIRELFKNKIKESNIE